MGQGTDRDEWDQQRKLPREAGLDLEHDLGALGGLDEKLLGWQEEVFFRGPVNCCSVGTDQQNPEYWVKGCQIEDGGRH
jgi:hypothetical protein